VSWIPTTNGRLLHPATLLAIIRSNIGNMILETWKIQEWKDAAAEVIDYLQSSDVYLAADSVLQLQEEEKGRYVLTTGALKVIS